MDSNYNTPKGIDDALREGSTIEELGGDDALAYVDGLADRHGLPPRVDDTDPQPKDKKEKVDPQKVAAALKQLTRPLTQIGNAERFVDRHGQDIRYCVGTGWYVWVGTHWQRDDANRVQELAKATVRAIPEDIKQIDVRGLSKADVADLKENLANWAKGSETQRMITAILTLASSDPRVVVHSADLDANLYAFNVQNGTLVFTAAGDVTLKAHDRADLITRVSPVAYDPEAVSTPIVEFFSWVCNHRPELLCYLLRVLGSCLVGVVREHVFHVWYGSGRNGKGATLRLMQKLLGEYACAADVRTFVDSGSKVDGASHKEDIARLQGRRLVSAEEANRGQKLDVARIKTLTGGDTQSARLPYSKHSIEFKPAFTLIVATNHRPYLPPDDRAAWDRIRAFPFDAVATEEMRAANPNFEDDLAKELPGLLNLLVGGCQEWLRSGLQPPSEVVQATEAYRDDVDFLKAFIEDACLSAPDVTVPARQLYGIYMNWAKEAGEHPMSKRKFIQAVRERDGIHTENVGHLKILTFIGLTPKTEYTCGGQVVALRDLSDISRPWGSDGADGWPAA